MQIRIRRPDYVDANSCCSRSPDKVLEAQEREKKRKDPETCLQQRRHFPPFVVSTDGLLGKEAKVLIMRTLAAKLAEQWEKPYSEVCGYVRERARERSRSEGHPSIGVCAAHASPPAECHLAFHYGRIRPALDSFRHP